MIPYEKEKIQSFLDVKDEYPKLFNIDNLNDKRVKKFTKEELKTLIQKIFDSMNLNVT